MMGTEIKTKGGVPLSEEAVFNDLPAPKDQKALRASYGPKHLEEMDKFGDEVKAIADAKRRG